MIAAPDILKPAEAAVVAGVTLRDVNRAIDERILPESTYALGRGRGVSAPACTMLAFYYRAADRLTAEERVSTIRAVAPDLYGRWAECAQHSALNVRGSVIIFAKNLRSLEFGEWRASTRPQSSEEACSIRSWLIDRSYLTIDMAPFVETTYGRYRALSEAKDMVVSSPEILGGLPVIRNTRVPVYDVAASVAAGESTERILEAYPTIDEEKINLASLYATANPPRGRPRPGRPEPDKTSPRRSRKVVRREASKRSSPGEGNAGAGGR